MTISPRDDVDANVFRLFGAEGITYDKSSVTDAGTKDESSTDSATPVP